MDNTERLSLAFLQRQPQASALQLQEFAPDEAAVFLAQMPLPVQASTLSVMASWPAAQVLSKLSATKSSEVLRELPTTKAESLLRLVTTNQRDQILQHMPDSSAKSFRLKLSYPLSTVGAWMDTSIPAFSSDSSVADCLEQIKQHQSHPNGIIMVVNEFRHLLGLASVDCLLVSQSEQALLELLDTGITPLSTRTSLWEAKCHSGWSVYPSLPVTDRNNVVVGALTHSALTEGTNKSASQNSDNHRFSLVTHMARAFFVALSGLVKVVFSVPDNRPSQPLEKSSHD